MKIDWTFWGLLFLALAGDTRASVVNRAADGEAPIDPSARLDRRTHALTSKLIAEKSGQPAADLAGVGQEAMTGLFQALTGGKFFGESGSILWT